MEWHLQKKIRPVQTTNRKKVPTAANANSVTTLPTHVGKAAMVTSVKNPQGRKRRACTATPVIPQIDLCSSNSEISVKQESENDWKASDDELDIELDGEQDNWGNDSDLDELVECKVEVVNDSENCKKKKHGPAPRFSHRRKGKTNLQNFLDGMLRMDNCSGPKSFSSNKSKFFKTNISKAASVVTNPLGSTRGSIKYNRIEKYFIKQCQDKQPEKQNNEARRGQRESKQGRWRGRLFTPENKPLQRENWHKASQSSFGDQTGFKKNPGGFQNTDSSPS